MKLNWQKAAAVAGVAGFALILLTNKDVQGLLGSSSGAGKSTGSVGGGFSGDGGGGTSDGGGVPDTSTPATKKEAAVVYPKIVTTTNTGTYTTSFPISDKILASMVGADTTQAAVDKKTAAIQSTFLQSTMAPAYTEPNGTVIPSGMQVNVYDQGKIIGAAIGQAPIGSNISGLLNMSKNLYGSGTSSKKTSTNPLLNFTPKNQAAGGSITGGIGGSPVGRILTPAQNKAMMSAPVGTKLW